MTMAPPLPALSLSASSATLSLKVDRMIVTLPLPNTAPPVPPKSAPPSARLPVTRESVTVRPEAPVIAPARPPKSPFESAPLFDTTESRTSSTPEANTPPPQRADGRRDRVVGDRGAVEDDVALPEDPAARGRGVGRQPPARDGGVLDGEGTGGGGRADHAVAGTRLADGERTRHDERQRHRRGAARGRPRSR